MGAPEAADRPALPADVDRLLHDLRGPLNAAVMHLELCKRLGPDDAEAARCLDTAQQALTRLAQLLPLAFEIVALEPRERVRVDLRALVEGTRRTPGLERVTLAEGPWPDVHGDRRLLALALTHLLRNAVEATEAAGGECPPPRVGAAREGHSVVVSVRDWGRGFRGASPKSLLRLTASTKPAAAGVGLLTALRVARLHGGGLELVAPPGGGAEVRLRLRA